MRTSSFASLNSSMALSKSSRRANLASRLRRARALFGTHRSPRAATDEPIPSMRYNADIAPDPHAWLETDETERLIAIEAFHARVRDRSPSPRLHALVHLIVENQLVLPDQEKVHETFTR